MAASTVTLLLAGDVMTGRGVDQILQHPSSPLLHEPWVRDAREYVRLAEERCGPVPRCVDPPYIWGDALVEWDLRAPAARIVNLETAITSSDQHYPYKSIHYRMHPANIACLSAARVDVCVLANNHVLDYGRGGLTDTVHALDCAGIKTVGAGCTAREARQAVALSTADGRRVRITACAHESSGIPDDWAALASEPGVDLLPDLSAETAAAVASRVTTDKQTGDIALVSIHWGDNWGYDVPARHVAFAHRLIDCGVDVVHGHSSHHPRPIEVYKDRLILYGCGDFIDDYEGITGYERYRDDLVLTFFPLLDFTGQLRALEMTPMQIRRLRLTRASAEDTQWLCATLNRISRPFNAVITVINDGTLRWSE